MTNNAGEIDREALGFATATRKAFAPIAAAHGLIETSTDPYRVTYQGPTGSLTVAHDERSYELYVSLIPNSIVYTGQPYHVSAFIRVVDPDAAERYRDFAATTPSGVSTGVGRLAHDLATYGERALAADDAFLKQVELLRREASVKIVWERERASDAAAAAEAFRRKDWQAVVDLYEPLEAHLNRTEAKRLDIARKRRAGT